MQDWTGCSDLEQDDGSNGDRISITLTDKRDGNEYSVAKLKDGKCWMTQNLRIGKDDSIELTSDDSDVLDNFVLPASNINGFNSDAAINVYIDPVINYGGHYTMNAAIASSGKSVGEAPYSICPKNWKLPNENELSNFLKKYNIQTAQKEPVNYALAGSNDNGKLTRQGSRGYLRTSSVKGIDNYASLWCLYTDGNTSYGICGGGDGKRGFSVRCLKR